MKVAIMTELLVDRGMSQAEAIQFARNLGYDGIDISFFTAMKDDDEMMKGDYLGHARELKELCDRIGIAPVQCHTPFPIHRDGDEAYNQKMVMVQKKCLEICGVMGIPIAVIHPWNNWTPEENKKWYMELYPVAEKNHVIIATENMWNWNQEKDQADYAACSTPEDFLANVTAMNLPNFKACVDLGHAHMFFFDPLVSPERMIRVLGHQYCVALHVHDNMGRFDTHQIPYTGTIDWNEVIRALKEIHYQGNLVMELSFRKDAPLEILKAYFKDAYEVGTYLRKALMS